ncbi:MAG: ERCC4 domain-containing protein [Candidatus Nanoarchaeia archaeon]|nr:ERCC4 domain-containing protein [Candidatus Nanoarchaeia archaeon]
MKQIFDIFSKSKKEKTEEKPKVIMDYREKNSLVYSSLIELGMEIEVRELKVADYIVKGVAIERKTVSDFISSMISKRLASQLDNLQQYPNRLLLIEGIDEHELYSHEIPDKGIHPNAIRGFLLSIILEHKTPIIFTKDPEDTAKFISVLAKRKEREASLNVSRKNLDKKERMQFILEGFPGIGPKTAKKLLSHFKSLKEIFEAPIGELKEIIGIKAEVFRLLEERY